MHVQKVYEVSMDILEIIILKIHILNKCDFFNEIAHILDNNNIYNEMGTISPICNLKYNKTSRLSIWEKC